MPPEKHGFLTPKAISNRIKAKGLQKLRWYCQMCQKQCRDENGFQNHCSSENHLRMMAVFAEDPSRFIDEYSEEMEKGFLHLLSHRHYTSRVNANEVYQEYIADREHIHMNSTIWSTLSEFVKYLGREGKCVVEETPRGWFIQYIDRNPISLARQQSLVSKEKQSATDEERNSKFLEQQMKYAAAMQTSSTILEPEEVDLDDVKGVSLSLGALSDTTKRRKTVSSSVFDEIVSSTPSSVSQEDSVANQVGTGKRRHSEVDAFLASRKESLEREQRKDYWIKEGLVVKVLHSKLADGKYYKKKGVITGVRNRYTAEVEMLDSGDVLKLDQVSLETVIPVRGT